MCQYQISIHIHIYYLYGENILPESSHHRQIIIGMNQHCLAGKQTKNIIRFVSVSFIYDPCALCYVQKIKIQQELSGRDKSN